LNASDTIRQLVISGGSEEAKKSLAKMALEQLGDSEDSRSEIDKQLDEAANTYRMLLSQSRGTITEDMEEIAKRIEYLKHMKKMGKKEDG